MSYEPQPPIDSFHTSKDTNNNSNDATTPIDLTNILDDDDDDIEGVPDSLKSMVAEMNTKLASEQMDFFSMLAVDDDNNINSSSNHNNNNDGNHHHYHIASSDQLLMSPDLLVSPPPNPVNQMTETQVKRDLLFTPKPSLFGQPPSPLLPPPRSTELSIRPSEPLTTCTSTTNNDKNNMTTNLRMDYAAPDFFSTPYNPPPSFLLQQPSQLQPMTTILHQTMTMVQPPPPPSYEQPMSLGGGPTTSCIANYASRPPQPPSSPKPPVARAPSPQRRAPSPPQHSEWHELEKGTIETIDIDVFSTMMIPTVDMKLPPPPPETSTPSMFHVRASSPKRSVSPKPPKQPNMMIGTVLPNESSASNSKSCDKVSSHQPDPAIAIQNNVLMEQSGHIQPPLRDLETLLTIDALKYNLPPSTPASTVTGPQPLSTPPRSKLSRQQVHDSPSPLSMSSARSNLMTTTTNEERPTVVVPLPLPQRSSTLSSSQPPPVPPRFSPSPIAKSSNSTANDTTHAAPELSRPVSTAMEASSPLSNRSSDKTTSSNGSTKSSRRGDALAKMIASAAKKKSPDPQQPPTKSLRQRLFPSVVTRVAPAPREETKVHQQHQPLGRNNNIGELKSKPKSMPPPIQSRRAAPSATTVDEMFKWSTVSQQPQVKPLTKTIEATQLAKAANGKLQPSLVEEKPERRPIQVAESSALAQSKLQIVLPNAIPPVDNKLLFVTQTIDRPKDSPSDNDQLFLPPALVESSSSTAHFMTGTAVSTARGIGHKETTTATEKVVHIKPLEPTSHLLQTTTAAEGRKHREMEKEIDEPLHPKVHVKPLEPTSHLLQSTTAAEGRRHRDIEKKADDTHHHHTVGSLPLSSTSHLLQSTEARKQATVQPPTLVVHGSPQRVKKLSATSHLLQATAAAEARKTIRKERPLPPAAPPRRVVTGASDSLMKRTTTNKTKVDEGVAKAKERIRQRMLLATRSSSTPYSANSSRTSNSSQRSLTIPKSPKFATNTRHPADPDHKKENPRPSSLAQSDSLFGKSLRSADNSSVGTSFTSRKTNELTVPISPMFSTNARHGSKKIVH